MKLTEITLSTQDRQRAERRFRELLVQLTPYAPGKFKPIQGEIYYMSAASPDEGYMEVNLMQPEQIGVEPYAFAYIKTRHMHHKMIELAQELQRKGWKFKHNHGAVYDHMDVELL